jgi:hypothetical protein
VDVQTENASRQADVPAAQRIVFRIGINLGDVIGEGTDVFGDGVNIASAPAEKIARAVRMRLARSDYGNSFSRRVAATTFGWVNPSVKAPSTG